MTTTSTLRRLGAAAFALHCALAFAVPMPTTEPLDIDPDMAADIARQKARANSMRNALRQKDGGDRRSADPSAECGNINIGNVVGNRRIGFAPVDINVVVLGDILNVNNRCR